MSDSRLLLVAVVLLVIMMAVLIVRQETTRAESSPRYQLRVEQGQIMVFDPGSGAIYGWEAPQGGKQFWFLLNPRTREVKNWKP